MLQDVLAERLTAQQLSGPPATDAVAVARRLLAVQAQDLRGARLAVRARTRGLTAADVDRALGEERSVVITWLNRGTLHLVDREDYAWLLALTAPRQLRATSTRLAGLGLDPATADRGVAAIERALAAEGPLSRRQLRERLAPTGVPTAGQALIHLLALASWRGLVVRGPFAGREQAFALTRDWLGEPARVDRDAALAELARRYLAGHGPADERDLARWAGLALGEVRAGLRAIAGELEQRPDGRVALRGRPGPKPLPPPRLLGPFEPLLLGWCSRRDILRDDAKLVTVNGLFRAFALVAGRAVARWSVRDDAVALEPFAPLGARAAAGLARDGEDVVRFLARPGPSPR